MDAVVSYGKEESMMTITLATWQFWIIFGLCLFPTLNKILDWKTEKLRKENNRLTIEIKEKMDALHK